MFPSFFIWFKGRGSTRSDLRCAIGSTLIAPRDNADCVRSTAKSEGAKREEIRKTTRACSDGFSEPHYIAEYRNGDSEKKPSEHRVKCAEYREESAEYRESDSASRLFAVIKKKKKKRGGKTE